MSRLRGLLCVAALLWMGGSVLLAGQPREPSVRPQAGDRAAVIVFENLTGATEDDWIGRGIAETLSADLERIVGVLSVRPTNVDIRGDRGLLETGRRLGVSWVLGGGYQRLGDRIRITAQLVHVETETVTVAAKVDGLLLELFELQDRLTAELTGRPPSVPPPAETSETTGPDSLTRPAVVPSARGSGFAVPTLVIDGPPPPVAPETISRDELGRATMRAVRLPEPLALDGVLDEPIYNEVPPASGFIQQLPNEGAAATENTETWIFFDEDHVSVGAKLWDSAPPDMWVANDMRRDSFQIIFNDNFQVVFDTFYDRRNAVAFMVNPVGGFFDLEISDEANPNIDWNPIWEVRTGRFEQGWTVEMRVPFKSLRYRQSSPHVWGVQFARRVARKNEWSYLTQVPIAAQPGTFRVSAGATLVGLETPTSGTRFEVKPYGTGSSSTDLTADTPFSNEGDGDWGVDAKYGVTQNMVADFTYNTDFAQVEVDQQQINLTRFSLFFPEKREFFLEGRGTFDFGAAARRLGQGGGPSGQRGMGPPGTGGQGDAPIVFFSRRIGLEEGQTVPIIGGGRLTGKVGQLNVGALNIQTDDEPTADALGTNFTVVRLKQDILRRSAIGGIYTRRSVAVEGTGNGANEAYGLDGVFSFYDSVSFNGYYARTRTPGLVDDDESYQAVFTFDGDLYGLQVEHLLVGNNFNPEVGFLRRDDFRRTFVSAQYSPRPQSIDAVRQFTFGADLDYIENGAGQVETRTGRFKFSTELENADFINVDFQQNYELLIEPFEITPEVTILPGRYQFGDLYLSYFMGQRRKISGTAFLQRGEFFDGTITAFGYQQGRVAVTPQLYVEPTVSINQIDLPADAFTAALATARVTYTFTPRMFFSGLVQYNSTGESLGTNLRFRWEYQPGSELFVVYNDERDTSLRGTPMLETRAFIVKVTRLFRF